MIESRSEREDARDRATILDTLREADSPALAYSWHAKTEPLLWLADGLCGAVREHLLKTEHSRYFDRLQANGVIDEVHYISSSAT